MTTAQYLNLEKIGLSDLVELRYELHLEKKYTKCDWAERPVSIEKMEYLCQDTEYLIGLRDWLYTMLVEKDRLTIDSGVLQWRSNLIKHGLQEISLTGDIAIGSAQLIDFHGDPADRVIVATAIKSTMNLCTADQKILDWNHDALRTNARR